MKLFNKALLPEKFKASGCSCGIKRSGKLDLALFISDLPAKAACRFTANKVQAAPLKVCKRLLAQSHIFRAVIANSGNANCFTGAAGIKDADETVKELARHMRLGKGQVLVASTGIIGRRLPLAKIKKAIPGLVKGLSRNGISKASKAILTTDTFIKGSSVRFKLGSRMVSVCGVAKGAGMIAPDMRKATMLCFLFTDAAITQRALDKALGVSVDNSFNCISIDGCMSTNDSVMLMANGAAANSLINTGKDFNIFLKALDTVCSELAKSVVRDAEGATKFIEIKIEKAKNFPQAKRAALAVANSNLFKAAMYGENPNFGRIAAAIGASGIEVEEKDIRIRVSSLKKKNICVNVSLGRGRASAVVYTSDLTPEYVKINAGYSLREENVQEAIKKAKVLVEALPYIKKFHKKIIVIKYGGSILSDEKTRKGILEDIVFLNFMGLRPVLVHGGGPNISERIREAGGVPEFINGIRVTDKGTLRVVEKELKKLNDLIVKELAEQGVRAVGLNGKDRNIVQVKKKKTKVNLGLVGEITGINSAFLLKELKNGAIAVILPLGRGKDKKTYNVNADEVAAHIASGLNAEKMVLLTNVRGIMRNPDEAHSFISTLTIDEARGLIKNNIIQQGMIPKVESCIEALAQGVKKTHIIDARIQHALLLEIFTDAGIGTEIVN